MYVTGPIPVFLLVKTLPFDTDYFFMHLSLFLQKCKMQANCKNSKSLLVSELKIKALSNSMALCRVLPIS